MILNEIQTKLKELDEHVFYGMVDNSMQETLWNYIVFNRQKIVENKNKTGYTYYYTVHIIREEWIPEGFEIDVINKMLEINGMRLTGNDPVYSYVPKPNTNIVVEMLSIDFMKAKKA